MSHWTLTRQTTPTARKEHQCSGCHHTIRPGQTYRRLEGKYGGEWLTWKDCTKCVPWHENVAGGYVRPIDVLDKIDRVSESPTDFLGDAHFDGAVLTLYGLELHGNRTNPAIYQASNVPGVGLTGWVQVAREAPGFAALGWEEVA